MAQNKNRLGSAFPFRLHLLNLDAVVCRRAVMRSGVPVVCRRSWWRSVTLSGALRRSVCVCALVALFGSVWLCMTFYRTMQYKRPSRLFAFPDGVLCGFSVWSIVLLLVAVYAVFRGFLYSSIKAALTASIARRSSAYIQPSSSPGSVSAASFHASISEKSAFVTLLW